jgi:hypothetical protein
MNQMTKIAKSIEMEFVVLETKLIIGLLGIV